MRRDKEGVVGGRGNSERRVGVICNTDIEYLERVSNSEEPMEGYRRKKEIEILAEEIIEDYL